MHYSGGYGGKKLELGSYGDNAVVHFLFGISE